MVLYSALSNPGNRDKNEDSIDIVKKDESYLFALADGLGGHRDGAKASQIAVESASTAFVNGSNILDNIFIYAQGMIMSEQSKRKKSNQMKTTLACLQIVDNQVTWGHIGDSRIYYFKNKRLCSRTLDHSVPQMLVTSGELSKNKLRLHEDKNKLLRVMGIEWDSVKYEIAQTIDLNCGDAFLLCSDGFWENILESKMIRFLRKSRTPIEWLNFMGTEIEKKQIKKNLDDYSAIAIFVIN